MGARHQFTGNFIDPSAGLNPDGDPFIVESWQTVNLYAQMDIDANGPLDGTRLRVALTNARQAAPLADETFGYYNEYHSGRGRYFYFDIRKTF